MNAVELGVLMVTVFAGAFLQGSVGFGLGMISAPVVAIIDPSLIPGTIILLATVLTAVITLRERASVNRSGVAWALVGRIPGSVGGAALVAILSPAMLAIMVGVAVLGGAVLSLLGWTPALSRRNLVSAGMAAGVMGTATAIGGPPVAAVFQRYEPAEARGSLSVFFLVGSIFSFVLLLMTGAIDGHVVATFGWLLPALFLGYGASRLLVPFLNRQRMRTLAIVMSCTSAGALLVQQTVGLWG